ncbi:uncharacterized protein BJX67DRAFT_345924 [Aspergillus lucknowensis]|uniref:Uncharacterized protein n=1 Tax=Aspergillus lucknowensis TaxID=176173 RepID=A0ABR4M110_9EURO
MYKYPSTYQCFSAMPAPPPKHPTSIAPRRSGSSREKPNSSNMIAFSGVSAYQRRNTPSNRKGNPRPSLPPASDGMNPRRCRGALLSTNGPLAMT